MKEEFESSRGKIIRAIRKTEENLTALPHQIEGIVWPAAVMKVVLAQKLERRRNKEIPFNYMVTEFIPNEKSTDYSLENNKELSELVKFLKANHHKLPIGLRFQLAVLTDGHWSCVDNVIASKGISAFNLDAVMDSRSRHFFQVYLTNFQMAGLLSAGYLYYVSVPPGGPFSKTPKEKVANMIQTDWVSCGLFVVDHLSFLSRTNVFQHLKSSFGEADYIQLGRADIPPSLSAIFRLSQSELLLESLSSKQKATTVNRKGTLLGTIKYSGVRSKREKILQSARIYVEQSDNEKLEKIFSHNLVEHLSQFAANYSPAVNNLIEVVYNVLPKCKSLLDEEAIKLMDKLHGVILLSELNDTQKILAIANIVTSTLEKRTDISAYRLIASVLTYAVLHINNNEELFGFYINITASSICLSLNSNTNSFFSRPTGFTPSLLAHLEKAVKVQLLYNAIVDQNGRQLQLLNEMTGCSAFINKTRTFNTSETKSSQLLKELILLSEKEGTEVSRAKEVLREKLEESKKEILKEFNFTITESLSSTHSSGKSV
ncbi:hypothetical protein [Legionella hackeliae]|uniref:Uncharacterized protein n=1 Tax=Legionella hackeliae TaxID=449 RepID=A0A0A8USK7_LEGHA|nr:hypothetical protein [Legionella hackeliae]KTD10549.1 Dot/Icm T4SS effector [Legionella hackeliae]CEK10052.1 protein of unknown function [Legionella hackeliae]STX46778.1 Dot/Icm T4SS effector [Legionella hackeliae]